MRICRFILGGSCVLALLLVAPASAFAAGFQNSGQSATATGMAYGGVANPDEPNASFYNPALMGFQDGYRIYVGDTLIMPKTTFQPEGGGDEVATERDFFPPPHVHLGAHNIADSGFSAGVGLSFPYGLGIEWPEDWVGRANIQRQSLRTANINPNIAYRLPDLDLSFAVGAQIMASAIEYERSIPINEDEDEFVDAELGGDGVGFGGNAAVMYRPTDELTLGAQYRSRAKVDYEGSVHFEGEEDTAFYQTFRDNPATASITMPDLIAVGGGYQVLDNLFLHLEVDYTLWETYDEINADIDTGDDEDAIDEITIVNDWENAFAFRLGGQYDVTEEIPLRLGFAYDRTPIPDETVNASLPDNDRLVGTAGLGYQTGSFRADLAYSVVQTIPRDIDNDRAPTGEYATRAHLVALSLGYSFE